MITITATPDGGYKFGSWSDGDTNASRQITVDRDINLSCEFEEIPKEKWRLKNQTLVMTVSSNTTFSNLETVYNNKTYKTLDIVPSWTGIGPEPPSPYPGATRPFILIGEYTATGGTPLLIYNNNAWKNYDQQHVITLDEPATGDLLTFLQANATKIS